MSIAHVIGVDPGLVDTGVVSMEFWGQEMTVCINHSVIAGPDAQAVAAWIKGVKGVPPKIYIEKYQPRAHLNSDSRMLTVQTELRQVLPHASFLLNHGVKKVITKELMELLQVHAWPTTHHQDLRSAARIALYGMVKDDITNQLVAAAVRDHLDGRPWVITHV